MNGEIDWLELYKAWHQKQTDYFSAQKALDEAMSAYLAAQGPPPSRQVMKRVEDLRHHMFEARGAMDAFIADHAADQQEKHNLPRHE